MPAKKLWIVKHKLLATGGAAGAGYLYWHHQQTGSWLPSSITGTNPTGQGYTPGQTAGQYYPPSGMPYGGGGGGSNYPYPNPNAGINSLILWLLHHRFGKRNPKPRPHQEPLPGRYKRPPGWGRRKRHNGIEHRHWWTGPHHHHNRFHKSGGAPIAHLRPRGKSNLRNKHGAKIRQMKKYGYMGDGPMVQRPVAHFQPSQREGHIPNPRPSAPPPRTLRRQGK